MSSRLESIRIAHSPFPDRSIYSFFTEIIYPRRTFTASIVAIEKLISLARTMTPNNDSGDWGQWSYHRGFGWGALYTPFGKNGISAVYLQCGGDIGEDDIQSSGFDSAYAVWKANPTGKKEYTATLAYPGGHWYQNRGGDEERRLRKYFFYQETRQDLLVLECFGSQSLGWFGNITPNLNSNELEVELDTTKAPFLINGALLIASLNLKRSSGSVSPQTLD